MTVEPVPQGAVEVFGGTEGYYMLPHHQTEIERLKRQHEFVKSSTDNELLGFPLAISKSELRVLDSGCADGKSLTLAKFTTAPELTINQGTWLADVASQHPHQPLSLHGVDIGSALFQANPGLDLRAHNILHPFPQSWGWENSFDIVHQRFLVWGLKKSDWPLVVHNLCSALKPGGYIQLVECKWIFPENWNRQSEQRKLALTQIWSTETFGMDINAYARVEGLFACEGLVDINTVSHDWGYGAAATRPDQRESSAEMWVEGFRHLENKIAGELYPYPK